MNILEQSEFLVLEYHKLGKMQFQKQFNLPKGPSSMTIHILLSKLQRTAHMCKEL